MTDRGGTVVRSGRVLNDAAIGVVCCVVLTGAVIVGASRYWIIDPRVTTSLGYLAVWIPLGAAIVVGTYRHGSGSLRRDIRLRFGLLDLLWGLALGLILRSVASLIEIAVYGGAGQAPATFATDRDGWWIVFALLAPVVVTPLIEELFFRGLLLRAVLARFGSGAVAIAVSGVTFAVLHLVQNPLGAGIALVLSTLVLGLALGTLTVLTGRLGGAIIAHVVFNGLVVVPALF